MAALVVVLNDFHSLCVFGWVFFSCRDLEIDNFKPYMRWALGFTPKNDVQLPRKANILFLMELTVLLPTRRSIVCKVFWVGGEAGI